MEWLRWMSRGGRKPADAERERLLRDLDNNWLHYTGPHSTSEDAWAIEKCIALLRGRESRWW